MRPIIKMIWAPVLLYALNSTPFISHLMVHDGGAFSGFDKFFHFLGGVAIANAMYVFCVSYGLQWWRTLPRYMRFILLVGVVAMVGIAWEWYEFLHDFFLGTHFQPSNTDTMGDLLFDTVGACITAIIFSLRKTKSRS